MNEGMTESSRCNSLSNKLERFRVLKRIHLNLATPAGQRSTSLKHGVKARSDKRQGIKKQFCHSSLMFWVVCASLNVGH